MSDNDKNPMRVLGNSESDFEDDAFEEIQDVLVGFRLFNTLITGMLTGSAIGHCDDDIGDDDDDCDIDKIDIMYSIARTFGYVFCHKPTTKPADKLKQALCTAGTVGCGLAGVGCGFCTVFTFGACGAICAPALGVACGATDLGCLISDHV